MPTINNASVYPDEMKKELTDAFGMVPSMFLTMQPEQAKLFWHGMRDFQMSDRTALPNKVKELIGLGVASQIPCHYCVLFHTEAARLNGANEQELQEAIYMAGLTRLGSTVLNGSQIDQATFEKEMRDIVGYIKKQKGAAKR